MLHHGQEEEEEERDENEGKETNDSDLKLHGESTSKQQNLAEKSVFIKNVNMQRH